MRKLLMVMICALAIAPVQAESLRDKLARKVQEKREAELMQQEAGSGKLALPVEIKRFKDVAYAAHAKQKLDIYLPSYPIKQAPIIMMVHGGAWRHGDKASATVVNNKAKRWVARGFIFVSVNYRLLPEANPLQQAEDVARALAYVQQHAAEWGGDGGKVILMGHSAGAHLVDVLSAAPALARAQGAQSWLGTVSLDTAAMDIVRLMRDRHYRFYDEAFGKDSTFWKAASPYHLLTSAAPPLLLVCSSTRPDHPCEHAKAFASHAATLGVKVEIFELALTHKQVNQNLGAAGKYTEAVEGFLSALDSAVAGLLKPGR